MEWGYNVAGFDGGGEVNPGAYDTAVTRHRATLDIPDRRFITFRRFQSRARRITTARQLLMSANNPILIRTGAQVSSVGIPAGHWSASLKYILCIPPEAHHRPASPVPRP